MPRPLYDRIDRAILDHLQHHGRTPNVDLAEAVRLSPSSCLRRTKALEADGVIAGYRAALDRARLGLQLTVFLSLKVDHSTTTSHVVEAALADMPHVVACHLVSGDADFLLELAVPDLATYERVLGDVLGIGPVRDARGTISIRTVVDRGPLPLDAWPTARD
ncbi:AsnC family transcriptional regulator [Streptomyces sulfonofaciens]|uniref:AsnC family transcriptional regulator n=1 Tax=Streptomyces sulfonofaciens TaxID=68272 RepID=A0A919FUX7_9ACTN|nr:Lrp/AsnC family transcriptional regulator [Streptomyces sulfonofaciens]GHH72543.1 AsnC family transcriptional regulator [Streptomyces sulfonofaciens]